LKAVKQIGDVLGQYGGSAARIDNLVYSLAIDNNMGQMYVAWVESKVEDGETVTQFRIQQVDTYVLCRPKELEDLTRHVHNILEWGKGVRLRQAKADLDELFVLDTARNEREEADSVEPDDSLRARAKKRKRSSLAQSNCD